MNYEEVRALVIASLIFGFVVGVVVSLLINPI
jgi:hypothetical protein